MENIKENWTKIIDSKNSLFNLKIKQIWQYRDLIYRFIYRDLVVQYKQTILGPLWYIVQPLLTTLMFTLVFGKIANIPSDGVPHYLFYLAGITCWSYFSVCLNTTSNIFSANQAVFGKIYFPRITVPISIVISNLLKFIIQFGVFLVFYFLYLYKGADIKPNLFLFLLPFLILITAGLSLGFGMVFSSFTTKYRDLKFLLAFAVQLWMYATPIIYPLSKLPEKYQWIVGLNPMTGVVCTFKFAFLGKGIFDWNYLVYSFVFMIILLFIGLLIFNKVEKNFMDTV